MTQPSARRISWRQAANDDLKEIIDYIAADNPDAAHRVLDVILNRVDSLAIHPYIGGVCPYYSKARQTTCGNYIIYYTVSRTEVSELSCTVQGFSEHPVFVVPKC